MSRRLLGNFADLPRPIWALFAIQIVMRGGDFVFPFLTMFLTDRLGLSEDATGFWIMANVASGLAGTIVAGKVSDHFGRKRVLAGCMAGTGTILLACGFLPPAMMIPYMFMIANFFQGSMRPIISAMIMDLCGPEQRKEGFSLSYLGINLGVAFGPAIAGFLYAHNLPWIFFGNAAALSLAIVVLVAMIPETRPRLFERLRGDERPVEGGALKAFLARPSLVAFCFVSLFISFCYAQTNFGLTLYSKELFGLRGPAILGTLMSLNGITVLAATVPITRLTARLSSPFTMGIGAFFYALGFGMMVFALDPYLLALSTFVWTLGEIMLAINSGAYLAEQTPANLRGRFQSIRELFSSAGRLASPAVFGALIKSSGVHVSWGVTASFALLCAFGYAGLHAWEKSRRVGR